MKLIQTSLQHVLAVFRIRESYRGSENILHEFMLKTELWSRFHCHIMGYSADYRSQRT
jgi:hypothetical protein